MPVVPSFWRSASISLARERTSAASRSSAKVIPFIALPRIIPEIGIAMRATALDQEVALAQGVNVGRMFGLSWAIAGAGVC